MKCGEGSEVQSSDSSLPLWEEYAEAAFLLYISVYLTSTLVSISKKYSLNHIIYLDLKFSKYGGNFSTDRTLRWFRVLKASHDLAAERNISVRI